MCENDAAVDAWIIAASRRHLNGTDGISDHELRRLTLGYYKGVIRELAATVPGVREWLMRNVP